MNDIVKRMQSEIDAANLKINEVTAENKRLRALLPERHADFGASAMAEAEAIAARGAFAAPSVPAPAASGEMAGKNQLARYTINHLGKAERDDAYGPWVKLLDVMGHPPSHPDDLAVQRFADAMKAKMAKQRAKGYSGWDDHAQCTDESLAEKLMRHTQKGDPVDVANFAMMLHQRHGGDTYIVGDVLKIAASDFAKRVASVWVHAVSEPSTPAPQPTDAAVAQVAAPAQYEADFAASIRFEHTKRGFDIVRFADHYDVTCSLQKSSLATEDAIWFGCDEANPRQLVPGKGWQPVDMPAGFIADTRMHLTQDQVRALLPLLQNFAETGDLAPAAPTLSTAPDASVQSRILTTSMQAYGSYLADCESSGFSPMSLHQFAEASSAPSQQPATAPDASVQGVTGPWTVRERRDGLGGLIDCFVESPAEGDMPYALEVLGDDYTGYGGVERKLAHCKLIVSSVNAVLATPVPDQQSDLVEAANAIVATWDARWDAPKNGEKPTIADAIERLRLAAASAVPAPPAGLDGSLLRTPISAANPLPPGCYCQPGQCQAPRIMGRQTPCRDPQKRDAATPAVQGAETPKGGE